MTAHEFHPTVLREYDIRGIVDQTLSVKDAAAIGRSFGTTVGGAGKTICLGYDGRLSSPSLAAALAEGLLSTGVNVKRVGLGRRRCCISRSSICRPTPASWSRAATTRPTITASR